MHFFHERTVSFTLKQPNVPPNLHPECDLLEEKRAPCMNIAQSSFRRL